MTPQAALQSFSDTKDPDAFCVLVESYQNLVYSVCRRQLPDADVDDAVQEVFVKLARNAESIRQEISSWIYRCSINTCTDTMRRKTARARREAEYARRVEEDTNAQSVQVILRDVDRAMKELTAEERELIVRYFLSGETQTDIANDLHVAQTTIKRRIDQAVEQLRSRLKNTGFGLTGAALATMLSQEFANAKPPKQLTESLIKIGLSGSHVGLIATATQSKTILAKLLPLASIAAIFLAAVMVYFSNLGVRNSASSPSVTRTAATQGNNLVSTSDAQTTNAVRNGLPRRAPHPAIPPMRIVELPEQLFVQESFDLPGQEPLQQQINRVQQHLQDLGLEAAGPLTYRKPEGLNLEPETEITIAIPVTIPGYAGVSSYIYRAAPMRCASLLVPQQIPPLAAIEELDHQIRQAGLKRTYRDRFVSLDIGPNPRQWWEVQMGITEED